MRLASVFGVGCLFGLVALGACSDSGGISTGTSLPTLVAVNPSDFLGGVTCADAPGGARRYVTTLTDLTDTDDGGTPFTLGSSSPAPCVQRTAFGFVVAGNRYVADLDIYDRDDIRPLGEGSRQMIGPDGTLTAPRWSTRCGYGQGDGDLGQTAQAVGLLTVYVKPCDAVTDTGSSATGLTVDVRGALGSALSCGSEPGQVARFEAALSGSTELPRSADCGQTTEAFTELEAGLSYGFDVTAFETGSTQPSWTTRCFGEARPGVVLSAACDPLSVAEVSDAGTDASP